MKYFLLFTNLLLAISACKESNIPPQKDNILNVRLRSDPYALNPIFYHGAEARLIHQYLYLPLADYDPNTYELLPVLIDKIPVEKSLPDGGVAYDFRIRNEATWDDGIPVTAEDYLFTIKCILFSRLPANTLRGYFDRIDKIIIDQKDSKAFTVTLDEYYMLSLNTAISIPLFPKHIYDPKNLLDDYSLAEIKDDKYMEKRVAENPVLAAWVETVNSPKFLTEEVNNNGPYKLVSWDKDRSLVIEYKPDYWGKNIALPYFQQGPEKINFYVIPDEVTVISQLKEGNLDVVNGISTSAFVDLRNNQEYTEDFNFYTPTLSRYYYLAINNNHPILSDRDVRLAMAHLIDVDKMISSIEKGMGTRVASLVHPLRSYYDEGLNPIPYDLEKAKKILLQDGWKDIDGDGDLDKKIRGEMQDFTVDVFVSEQPLGRYVALMLQENARQIGVNINIVTKSFRSYLNENVKTRDYGLAALVSSREVSTDDDFYQNWHSDNDQPNKNNYYAYSNPKVDELIDNIRVTKDRQRRIQLYYQLQNLIYEDTPVIFLYAPTEKIVVSKKWQSSATAKRPGYLANTFRPIVNQ